VGEGFTLKLGDHVWANAAQRNEVQCKFLPRNICVVHQFRIEPGIDAAFWQNEPAESGRTPQVLPLVWPG
jgi:hypothetical protein